MSEMQKIERQPRAAERERVLLVATVVSPQGSHHVRVRDLSKTGAQVVAEEPLPSGVDAIFQHKGVFAAARIVWSRQKEAGLQFYRELD